MEIWLLGIIISTSGGHFPSLMVQHRDIMRFKTKAFFFFFDRKNWRLLLVIVWCWYLKSFSIVTIRVEILILQHLIECETFIVWLSADLSKKVTCESVIVLFACALGGTLQLLFSGGAPARLSHMRIILILFLRSLYTRVLVIWSTHVHMFFYMIWDWIYFSFIEWLETGDGKGKKNLWKEVQEKYWMARWFLWGRRIERMVPLRLFLLVAWRQGLRHLSLRQNAMRLSFLGGSQNLDHALVVICEFRH